MKKNVLTKCSLLVFVVLLMAGCATPSQRFHQEAIALGFQAEILSTSLFQHQIYLNQHLNQLTTLHVYLDGDGTPWRRKGWIADDPTARNPLILKLMAQDSLSAILLGRPCYYGLQDSGLCENKYWTSHRYSQKVVSSMSDALNDWLKQHSYNEVVLVGFSGGGSLAVLMAENINLVSKVVTVAANLDIKAWSEFHGYSTLKDSLNPIDQQSLSDGIQQIHFAGKKDQIVPPFIIKKYAQNQKNVSYYELENQGHACCWQNQWHSILDIIND